MGIEWTPVKLYCMSDFLIDSLEITFNLVMVIHAGDQSDEEGDFWQTLPCRQLTEPFGGYISLFHSGRACALIKAVGKFFFWRRFFKAW